MVHRLWYTGMDGGAQGCHGAQVVVHRLWCTGMGCGAEIVMQGMGCGAWGQGAVHSTKCISGILHGRDGILQGWQWVS